MTPLDQHGSDEIYTDDENTRFKKPVHATSLAPVSIRNLGRSLPTAPDLSSQSSNATYTCKLTYTHANRSNDDGGLALSWVKD